MENLNSELVKVKERMSEVEIGSELMVQKVQTEKQRDRKMTEMEKRMRSKIYLLKIQNERENGGE